MEMRPSVRKFALTVHLVLSVGWIGAVAAYLVLDVKVATSADVETLRAAYIGMAMVTRWAIVPLAFGSLLTGLIMSLGTSWGLFRHYWVVISLVLTLFALVILMAETQTVYHYASVASDAAASDDDVRALGSTLLHSIGGTVVLLIVLVLNVYKPRGMTAYGWRKRQEKVARH